MQHLQPGSTLQSGKYKIEKMLGQGGFGITYLAENTMLEGKVAVKEFFFKDYCERDSDTSHVTITTKNNRELVERFKQKFVKEAKTLFRLRHPNIVQLLDIFEENDTAYYVMDYIEGESLGDMVKRQGALPEAEAIEYVRSVGSTLQFMHSKKLNHLDIKPNNLMKRSEDGQIIVIDFGTTKQYDAKTSEGTTTTPVGISHGYSPSEQYLQKGVQTFSPESDVYALAATLFKLLSGNTPPEANEVRDEGLPIGELTCKNVSPHVVASIQRAMKGRHERTQSVEALLADLANLSLVPEGFDDEATVLTVEAQDEERRKEAEAKAAKEKAEAEARAEAEKKNENKETQNKENEIKPKRNKAWFWAVASIIAIAGIGIEITALTNSNNGGIENEPSTTEASYNNGGIENEPSTTEASYNNGTLTVNGVSYDMIKVDGGTFTMGGTSEQGSDAYDDEKPTHQVTLSSYSIGKTEVTQALWEAVMGKSVTQIATENGWSTCGVGANYPMYYISWDDCQTFISKLNALTGQTFRLPTEAEWEYAARGGSKSRGYKYSGSNTIVDVAWYDGNSGSNPHPVGTKVPNELGIYDMSGNVYEWCSDWYDKYYYSSASQTNPKGPTSGSNRVYRGGSWGYRAGNCRVSSRFNFNPDIRYGILGVRLALSE